MILFAGTDILYVRQEGASCGPAERQGALKLADGGTLTIHATGMYCVPNYPVQFTFTVTDGTGKYRYAAGEEPSRLARPGITLPLSLNFGAAPFTNPDIFLQLYISPKSLM